MEFAVFDPEGDVKGIAILFGWTNSQPQHVAKYSKLWLEQGFRVGMISRTFSPGSYKEFGTFSKRIQSWLVDQLSSLPENKRVWRAQVFSGGGLSVFLQLEKLISVPTEDAAKRKENEMLRDAFRGLLFDSAPADIHLTTAARAMSAHLKGLKRHFVFLFMLVVIGIQLLASALGITKSVRKEYYDGLDRLVNGKLMAGRPATFIYSTVDPLTEASYVESFAARLRRAGTVPEGKLRMLRFPDSAHVAHLVKYPADYRQAVVSFIQDGKAA